jgi:chemotaxis signal transduction protein
MSAPEVRGIVNLRGRVLTLLDLRVLLGHQSANVGLEKLSLMLLQRKHDHADGCS